MNRLLQQISAYKQKQPLIKFNLSLYNTKSNHLLHFVINLSHFITYHYFYTLNFIEIRYS